MLILMPNASALWMAAGMLWILDASINVSMEPFRAFVADILPEGQRTAGFAMQSLFIGLGASLSSALPIHPDELLSHAAGGRRYARRSDGRAAFVLRRRRCVFGRGAVDHRHYEGISAAEDLEAFRRAKAEKTGPSRECAARF